MKQKVLQAKLFFIIFFILFLSKTVFAEAPIPWGAKLIRDDIAVTGNGEERKIASYETKASKQELINYYLKEMPSRGYSLFMNGERNLVFRKAEELVIVAIPPSPGGKTNFMVSTALMKIGSGMTDLYNAKASCEPIPSVPVYPGAGCMASTRLKSGGSRSAAYSVEDSSGVVLDFYRAQMPRYGWQLTKEFDLKDVMLKAAQGQQQAAMSMEQQAAIGDFLGNALGMLFTNQRGSGCTLYVVNNPASKGASIIRIIYDENKAPQI